MVSVWFRTLEILGTYSSHGGDDGIRFSRELRARSSAALTVINCHSLPLPFESLPIWDF